jgi:hypothetical protein
LQRFSISRAFWQGRKNDDVLCELIELFEFYGGRPLPSNEKAAPVGGTGAANSETNEGDEKYSARP